MNCDAVHMRPLPSRGLPFAIRRKIPYGSPEIKKVKALQEIYSSAPLLLCLLLYTENIESQTLLYTIIHFFRAIFLCPLMNAARKAAENAGPA